MPFKRLLVLGCGYAGAAVARAARAEGLEVLVSTRDPGRAASLVTEGFDARVGPAAQVVEGAAPDAATHVVICFPPDGETDALVARALSAAGAVTYVSSTGVYGEVRGRVDDATPLADPLPARAVPRVAAEATYRAVGATVLRCPGLYGPDRGLHVRVVRGAHQIPGDGSRALSRLHVEDLARFALAAGGVRGETFVLGDEEPAPHGDVVAWIAARYGVPRPPNVPLESVHETLRADRRVDASRARAVLGVTLRYPTYREGMHPEVTGIRAALG